MKESIFGNLIDPENRLAFHQERITGVRHLYRRSPLDPVPAKPIELYLTTGGQIPYSTARCIFTTDGGEPVAGKAQQLDLQSHSVQWDGPTWSFVRHWSVTLPAQPAGTLLRYQLEAQRSDTGEWVQADADLPDGNYSNFTLWIDEDPVPGWSRQAIIYQVFPDRFYPGNSRNWNRNVKSLNDFWGGTIRGIREKLEYIKSIGFNTIWLNPFLKSSSHHGYNASDYYTVEPRLGTNDELAGLINAAHSLGMRLVMDFVANHWSSEHFTFMDAQQNPSSPYHNWYTWKHWPDEYDCYFHVKELPKINLQFEPARQYMLDVARYWLQQGFDGYRLDFAYGPSHDFWVDFRKACREVNPDCWIFGEVVHDAEVQLSYAGIMDGTLDFHLSNAIRETFATDKMSLGDFEAFLQMHEAYFPRDYSRPTFLDNHDMTRFLYLSGNDREKLKLAALVLYTLSGPPIVYYGTEAGVSQERPLHQGNHNVFEEARLPMAWDSNGDGDLLKYFRRLGELRNNLPVLWDGTRRLVHLDTSKGTYAFLRENSREKCLIVLNKSNKKQKVVLNQFGKEGIRNLLDEENIIGNIDNQITIDLPAHTGALIN